MTVEKCQELCVKFESMKKGVEKDGWREISIQILKAELRFYIQSK